MVYLIIILLVAFGIVEFFLIKRGMKAGRKSSQYLRNPSSQPPANTPLRQGSHHQETLSQEREDAEELNETENVIRFPHQASHAAKPVNVNAEPQQEDQDHEPGDEESSALDLIQEIRGGGLASKRLEEPALPVKPLQPEESFTEEQTIPSKQEYIDEESSQEEPSPEERIKEGVELVRQGKLDEGIDIIEQAIQEVPDKADAQFNLGIAYTLKDNIPQAISAYKRAIDIDPQYGKAFYNLGTLHLKQRDIQEAIPKLERAVKLLADPMKALWNLYEAYRSSGLFTKALANLQRLIDLEPDDASLYNHLGICYVKLGDYAKAIDAWKRSIDLGASSQLIHYNLGKTYELYGEFANAEKHYTQFIERASKKPQWKDLLSEVEERLQNLRAS